MIEYIEWKRAAREIPEEDQSDFYNQPLPCTTIYQYQTSKLSLPSHRSHFSLKFTLDGQEDYCFGRRCTKLLPGMALFSNDGGDHDSSVQNEVHSLSIYLPKDVANNLTGQATAGAMSALDQHSNAGAEHDIPQVAFTLSRRTQQALSSFVARCPGHSFLGDNDALQLLSWRLTEHALRDILKQAPPWALQSVIKASVREELIVRVLRARDYLNDTRGNGYDLDGLATLACLSPYHLLRTFSDVVGETPGSYARKQRLESAMTAIEAGEEFHSVARKAGYQSVRRFKDALKKHQTATAHDRLMPN